MENRERKYRIGERKMSDGTSTFFVEVERKFDDIVFWGNIFAPVMKSKEDALAFIARHKAVLCEVETIFHDVE